MPLLLGALVLVWAAMLVLGGSDADQAALLFLYAGGKPELIDAAKAVTWLGGAEALLAATFLGLVRLAWRRDWRAALLLLAITLSGRLLVELQKEWTGRLRPETRSISSPPRASPSPAATPPTPLWSS